MITTSQLDSWKTLPQQLCFVAEGIDRIQWIIEDYSQQGKIDSSLLEKVLAKRDILDKVFKTLLPSSQIKEPTLLSDFPNELIQLQAHLIDKFFRLKLKIATLIVVQKSSDEQGNVSNTTSVSTLSRDKKLLLILDNQLVQTEWSLNDLGSDFRAMTRYFSQPLFSGNALILIPEKCDEFKHLLNLAIQLDKIYWSLEDQLKDHPVSEAFLTECKSNASLCFREFNTDLFKIIELKDQNKYFSVKYDRWTSFFLKIVPLRKGLAHQQFVERSFCIVSLKEKVMLEKQEGIPLCLKQISALLRRERESDVLPALEELWKQKNNSELLPQKNVTGDIKIFEKLTTGEKGAYNKELLRLEKEANERQALMKQKRLESNPLFLHWEEELGIFQLFETLSPDVQKAVYEALWWVRSCPIGDNPIAHENFGEVSFKNIEYRCTSSLAQKACAIEWVLLQLTCNSIDASKKIGIAKVKTLQVQAAWFQYDSQQLMISKVTNDVKKESLHSLAEEIVPLFMDDVVFEKLLSEREESYHVLASAYVAKYPCLRPVFLQLMNGLKFTDDPW